MTNREALAVYLGMDVSELSDYRYHYGHTSKPVYAVNDSYYCVTSGKQKPAEHKSMEFNWVNVSDSYATENGYTIFESK